MMGKAVEAAGPYLYPCTIEYSIMCAGRYTHTLRTVHSHEVPSAGLVRMDNSQKLILLWS